MYWVEPEEADVAAYDAAHAEFLAAVKRRDQEGGSQEDVEAAYRKMSRDERHYFRLNMGGMGVTREIMDKLGMVFWEGEIGNFPRVEDYDITWDDVEVLEEGGDALAPDVRERVDKYVAAKDDHLAYHGPEIPGIPGWKLCSNDGWVVTPAECLAVAKIWSEVTDEAKVAVRANISWFDEWMQWVHDAATHGGFKVY
jgi:hypothetical protein